MSDQHRHEHPAGTHPADTHTGDRHSADRPADRTGATIDRRRFLQVSGATAAAVGGGLATAGAASARSRTAEKLAPQAGHGSRPEVATPGSGQAVSIPSGLQTTPIRPPAAPLIVRSPYLSTWQASTVAPGTWQSFWNGQITAMGGIARIDGASYKFAGDPTIVLDVPNGGYGQQTTVADFEAALEQTKLTVTATRSVFTFQAGGVQITLEFLSGIEPGDLRRQSIPMSWVLVTAQSIDSSSHDVSVFLDISGEWLSGNSNDQFTWAPATVPYKGGTLQVWTLQLANQQVLTEAGDRALWGTIVWATPQVPGLTYQSGTSAVIRGQFVNQGALNNTNDTNYTSINGDGYPTFGFACALGSVGGTAQTRQFSLGQVRTPLVSYLGKNLQPLWTHYFSGWQDMLGFFHGDVTGTRNRATALDKRITTEATHAGGGDYAALCVLALRQAYGGTELAVGPDNTPWAFLKEISSDGDTSTVDVMFPASPVWVYLDPQYLSLLLKPIFGYPASGQWTAPFAPHDLGPYPNASGYPNNGGENMPVEESGNMIIMAAAYAQAAPGAARVAYLKSNYQYLKQWADYLVANLPDPGFQNQTDDFAGPIAHSVNLALKGIVAVAAMGQIAQVVGNSADAQNYGQQAQKFIAYWITNAQDPSGKHLDLTYNGAGDGDGTWGTTYNAFADSLLGTNLVPTSVAAEQATFYETVSNMFGLPLQIPHSYAKTDWEMWIAAWLHSYPISQQLIEREYLYANATANRVPFSDLYSTISGRQVGFQNRPVQGGIFALLALQALQARRSG